MTELIIFLLIVGFLALLGIVAVAVVIYAIAKFFVSRRQITAPHHGGRAFHQSSHDNGIHHSHDSLFETSDQDFSTETQNNREAESVATDFSSSSSYDSSSSGSYDSSSYDSGGGWNSSSDSGSSDSGSSSSSSD